MQLLKYSYLGELLFRFTTSLSLNFGNVDERCVTDILEK